MLKSLTAALATGVVGFLSGVLLPALVAYSILFLRRRGHHFKMVLRLCGRLLLAFLIYGLFIALYDGAMGRLGGLAVESTSWLIGSTIGFWGAVVALVVGARRARKRSTAP